MEPHQPSVKQMQEKQNLRIYERNIPSAPLQPYLDVRAVPTKYSFLPIVDPRKPIGVPMEQLPVYSPHSVFNPGSRQGPWSGFASSVNKESELRNQVFALQKCSQSTFVPNSNSDLYQFGFRASQNNHQAHDLLFQKDKFCAFNPNPNANLVGFSSFYNSTRSQMKDVNGPIGS
jgi:hypothetical protein